MDRIEHEKGNDYQQNIMITNIQCHLLNKIKTF